MRNRFILLSGIVLSLLLSTCLGGVVRGTSRTALDRRDGDSLIHPRADSPYPHATVIDKGKGKAGPTAEAVNLSSGEKPLSANEVQILEEAFKEFLENFSSPEKRKQEVESGGASKRAKTTNTHEASEDEHAAGSSNKKTKAIRIKKRKEEIVVLDGPVKAEDLLIGISYRTKGQVHTQMMDGSHNHLFNTGFRRILFLGDHVAPHNPHKYFLIQGTQNVEKGSCEFLGANINMKPVSLIPASVYGDVTFVDAIDYKFNAEEWAALIHYTNTVSRAAPEGQEGDTSEERTGNKRSRKAQLTQEELEKYSLYTTQDIAWVMWDDKKYHHMGGRERSVVSLGGEPDSQKFVLMQRASQVNKQKKKRKDVQDNDVQEESLLHIGGVSHGKLGHMLFTPVLMRQGARFRRSPIMNEPLEITEEVMEQINAVTQSIKLHESDDVMPPPM